MKSCTCSDTLRAGPSSKRLAFEWRKQSFKQLQMKETILAPREGLSPIQTLSVSPFYLPLRYPNAEHLDKTPTGLECFFHSWQTYQDWTYNEMIAFQFRKKSWQTYQDLTYIETLLFQCRKESWGRAHGERDRALANAASNTTGGSAQTKGCEQHDNRGKSANNANNMTGRGRVQTTRSMQQRMQTPCASNMTGRGHAGTTQSMWQGGGCEHVCKQNAASNKTGRGHTQIKTGQEKTNASNTPYATGGCAKSSTKHDNQTKNTASGWTQKLNETQWFCLWEVVLTLAGILVCSWEVVLAEWLSPVIWELGKKKIMSHVEVLVPT